MGNVPPANAPASSSTRSLVDIVESDAALLKKKQNDYATGADPWLNFREASDFVSKTRGVTFNALDAAYFLLGLKISRLKNLGGRAPSNESKLDTLQDLRGYSAIIQAMEEEGAVSNGFDKKSIDRFVAEMDAAIAGYRAKASPDAVPSMPRVAEVMRWAGGGTTGDPVRLVRDGDTSSLLDDSSAVGENGYDSIGRTDDDDDETLEQEAGRDKADTDRVYRVLFNEDIGEVAALVHDIAVNKGWWDDAPYNGEELSTSEIAEKLLMIHTEVSEATEALRETPPERLLDDLYDDDKPIGFTSELADIIIRVLDLAAGIGVDIRAALADKIIYNSTRSFRHGGKRI